MRMPSRRASWRRRISSMSSAWISVRSKRAISAGFGSSASRMQAITSSMRRKAIMRPSRMWMRRSTSSSRWRVRRSTVTKRKSIHSRTIATSPFCCGRPSRPIMVILTDTLLSRLVWASSTAMNSSGDWREERGSSTMRTAALSLDSSRTVSSTPSTSALKCLLILRDFLLARSWLRVGQGLDLGQHLGGRYAMRQFVDDDAPLPARLVFLDPARAHAQAAAAGLVGFANCRPAAR